jgi:hypothetical protein
LHPESPGSWHLVLLEQGRLTYLAMELSERPWRQEDESERIRVSKLQLYKGYMKLESSIGDSKQDKPSSHEINAPVSSAKTEQQQRKTWRFRVKRIVRVLYSTISRALRRLRDSYAKLLLAMATNARDSSLLTLRASLKRKPRSIRTGSMFMFASKAVTQNSELWRYTENW